MHLRKSAKIIQLMISAICENEREIFTIKSANLKNILFNDLRKSANTISSDKISAICENQREIFTIKSANLKNILFNDLRKSANTISSDKISAICENQREIFTDIYLNCIQYFSHLNLSKCSGY
jgi:hypothetical protein